MAISNMATSPESTPHNSSLEATLKRISNQKMRSLFGTTRLARLERHARNRALVRRASALQTPSPSDSSEINCKAEPADLVSVVRKPQVTRARPFQSTISLNLSNVPTKALPELQDALWELSGNKKNHWATLPPELKTKVMRYLIADDRETYHRGLEWRTTLRPCIGSGKVQIANSSRYRLVSKEFKYLCEKEE